MLNVGILTTFVAEIQILKLLNILSDTPCSGYFFVFLFSISQNCPTYLN